MRPLQNPLLLLLLLCFPLVLIAGDDDEDDVRDLPFRERIMLGGNIGLQISNVNTVVVISPRVSYRLTNRLTPGLGATYQYYRDTGWGNMAGFTSVTHLYGGSAFLRYTITRDFFALAEYEALNLDSQMSWQSDPANQRRFWEHNYFLGGGYRARIGERTFVNLMLLYNFNQNSVVYFQNPIFRLGVDVRL